MPLKIVFVAPLGKLVNFFYNFKKRTIKRTAGIVKNIA